MTCRPTVDRYTVCNDWDRHPQLIDTVCNDWDRHICLVNTYCVFGEILCLNIINNQFLNLILDNLIRHISIQ